MNSFIATFTTQTVRADSVRAAFASRGLTDIPTPKVAAGPFVNEVQTSSVRHRWNVTPPSGGGEEWRVFVKSSDMAGEGTGYQTLPGEYCNVVKLATSLGGSINEE